MKKLLIPIFATALLFTACSSDSGVDKEPIITMAAESVEAEAGFYSEEYVECVLEGIVEETDVTWEGIEEIFEQDGNLEALGDSTSDAQNEAVAALAFSCMADTDVFQDLMDDAIEDILESDGDSPMEFGDDEYLDGLYTECDNGDGDACETLYWESPLGSEYEQFGLSCAGRWDC